MMMLMTETYSNFPTKVFYLLFIDNFIQKINEKVKKKHEQRKNIKFFLNSLFSMIKRTTHKTTKKHTQKWSLKCHKSFSRKQKSKMIKKPNLKMKKKIIS